MNNRPVTISRLAEMICDFENRYSRLDFVLGQIRFFAAYGLIPILKDRADGRKTKLIDIKHFDFVRKLCLMRDVGIHNSMYLKIETECWPEFLSVAQRMFSGDRLKGL